MVDQLRLPAQRPNQTALTISRSIILSLVNRTWCGAGPWPVASDSDLSLPQRPETKDDPEVVQHPPETIIKTQLLIWSNRDQVAARLPHTPSERDLYWSHVSSCLVWKHLSTCCWDKMQNNDFLPFMLLRTFQHDAREHTEVRRTTTQLGKWAPEELMNAPSNHVTYADCPHDKQLNWVQPAWEQHGRTICCTSQDSILQQTARNMGVHCSPPS